MPSCCDCGKEEFLYSLTCSRTQETKDGPKEKVASRCLCIDCANKERQLQGLSKIKEVK